MSVRCGPPLHAQAAPELLTCPCRHHAPPHNCRQCHSAYILPPFYPRKACTHQHSSALPQGINVTALREIKLLQELRSPHLVQLLDVFAHKRKNLQLVRARRAAALSKTMTCAAGRAGAAAVECAAGVDANGGDLHETTVRMHSLPEAESARLPEPQVFEYCETDLELVIKDSSLIFAAADVKAYMRMVLQALDFCHKRWVLHRDVKPNNFLVSPNGACFAIYPVFVMHAVCSA